MKEIKKKSIGRKILLWIARIFGVYCLWFLTGILLVETGVLDRFPLGFGGHITNGEGKPDHSKAGWDGPHIEFSNAGAIVRSVVKLDTTFVARSDSFSKNGLAEQWLVCQPVSAPAFKFGVKLSRPPELNSSFELPSNIFVLSDIEGNFDALRNLLWHNGVMNSQYEWTFGQGHLVVLGDIMDRGLEVTQCLWLLYHLELQAELLGGKVHLVLGNHEVMNLNGAYAYVRNQYLENAKLYQWEYKEWYSDSTVLGHWLGHKKMLLKLGPFLFAHGGVSPDITDFTIDLDSLNILFSKYVRQSELAEKSQDRLTKWCFDTEKSPFWFRGYVDENVSKVELQRVLQYFRVKTMVVGHTVVDRVGSLYDGGIIAIDTRHAKGVQEGLLWRQGVWMRVDATGKKYPLEPL